MYLIVNFEHISHLVLIFLLSAMSRSMPTGSVVCCECFTAAFQKAHHTIYTLQKTFGKLNKISSKNYLFTVKNRNYRTRHEICSKLTIKTTDRSKLGIDFTSWFCVFIVDFQQLIGAVTGFSVVLLLLILNRYFLILLVVFLNC